MATAAMPTVSRIKQPRLSNRADLIRADVWAEAIGAIVAGAELVGAAAGPRQPASLR